MTAPDAHDPPARPVDVAAAQALAADRAVFLDVRSLVEWNSGHIAGAVHLPIEQLHDRLRVPDSTLPFGDRPVVTVCGSGRRAQQAAMLLADQGRDAAWLDGGLRAWTDAGLALTTGTTIGTAMTAGDWDARYSGNELVWTALPNKFLLEQTTDLSPGSALDLACGEGRNTVWLASRGWRATGIDFSATALGKAEQLAKHNGVTARWEQLDLLTWQPEQTYDLVLLAYLQLPAQQRQQVLASAARATAPGGSLLLIAHDLANLNAGVGGPRDPLVLWTPDGVDLPGFHPLRRDTARRPTATGDALDTVVHLIRQRDDAPAPAQAPGTP